MRDAFGTQPWRRLGLSRWCAAALADLADLLRPASRILVLGGGKAGAAMAEAVEHALADQLIGSRGSSTYQPMSSSHCKKSALTPLGRRVPIFRRPRASPVRRKCCGWPSSAAPNDVALCLLSGGGSALARAGNRRFS